MSMYTLLVAVLHYFSNDSPIWFSQKPAGSNLFTLELRHLAADLLLWGIAVQPRFHHKGLHNPRSHATGRRQICTPGTLGILGAQVGRQTWGFPNDLQNAVENHDDIITFLPLSWVRWPRATPDCTDPQTAWQKPQLSGTKFVKKQPRQTGASRGARLVDWLSPGHFQQGTLESHLTASWKGRKKQGTTFSVRCFLQFSRQVSWIHWLGWWGG